VFVRDIRGPALTLFRDVAKAYRRRSVGVHTVAATHSCCYGQRETDGCTAPLPCYRKGRADRCREVCIHTFVYQEFVPVEQWY
jgi:hypothetical protein